MTTRLTSEYREHKIFKQIDQYGVFYDSLSFSVMNWISQGTKAIFNLDTSVYLSMQGTMESIKEVLINGRINDAYSLLRKYYDSTIINVYLNHYLSENFNFNNFIVDKVENWRNGSEKLPLRAKLKFKKLKFIV